MNENIISEFYPDLFLASKVTFHFIDVRTHCFLLVLLDLLFQVSSAIYLTAVCIHSALLMCCKVNSLISQHSKI